MYRGATSTVCLNLITAIDLTRLTTAKVAFKALSKSLFVDVEEVNIDRPGKRLYVSFTQEQSLSFPPGVAEVQAKLMFSDDRVYVSDISRIRFRRTLDTSVMYQLVENPDGEEEESEMADRIGLRIEEGQRFGGVESYNELKNLPKLDGVTIMGNIHEKDPNIFAWARQPNKPEYTPGEIGLEPIPLADINAMFRDW